VSKFNCGIADRCDGQKILVRQVFPFLRRIS